MIAVRRELVDAGAALLEHFVRRGASAGLGRRSPLPCSDLLSRAMASLLDLTFATRKPLNGLGEARASKVLTSASGRPGVTAGATCVPNSLRPLANTCRPVIPEHRSRSAVSARAGLSPNLPRPLRGAKWGQASWLYNDHLALTLRGIHSMFGRQGRRF